MRTPPCYCATLRRATRRVTALYDQALAGHGITLAQFSLLRTLRRHGPISLTDLAARMELDRSTIGRNIRVVEKAGWVQPATTGDQRETAIEISPAGLRLLEETEPDWTMTQQRVEAKLGTSGVLTLLDNLARL
jgi:DNA-binding MarR family transcriptional regulator